METPGSIYNKHVNIALLCGGNRVVHYRRRVRSLVLANKLHACSVTPYGKLIDCRRAEGIRRRYENPLALGPEIGGNFSDGGGLAHAVYSDHENDRRMCVKLQRLALTHKLPENFTKCALYIFGFLDISAFNAFPKLVDDIFGGLCTHIGADEYFLKLFKKLLVNPAEVLYYVFNLTENGVLGLFESLF